VREGQQAMAEYQAELQAMRDKTARLRALRAGSRRRRSQETVEQNGPAYAASGASSIGSTIEASSFSGLLTRVEIGHIRIRSAGNGRINSLGTGSLLSQHR
jgi:hypothetical protein